MSTTPVISSAEAENLVLNIAKKYGWISRTAREQSHQEALDAIQTLQTGLGAAARTLAQNLYRSNARFLFELIQNADDNNYIRATACGEEPYIKFTIRPNTIVIDCNEDGFTPDNVRAICRIGESTKTRANAQYYIGEKGIGFKSVFMVASKVHIQSGPFSFFFEHEPGNNGMGMITPEWEPTDITLDEPLTRITLTLLESLDLDDLLSQFDDLPHTLLLFLNKIGKIIIDRDVPVKGEVEVDTASPTIEKLVKSDQETKDEEDEEDKSEEEDEEDENEDEDEDEGDENEDEDEEDVCSIRSIKPKSITTYSCEFDKTIGRAKVKFVEDFETEDSFILEDEYRITRRTLSNLPVDPQRDYNTAEIVLAFPVLIVEGNDWPAKETCQVYAYLPIRDFGFPFIIHSDFVTQASREDVMENARNKAILEGVAEAFVDAVIQFSQHPVLQYRWIDYIPEQTKIPSPFWLQVLTRIKEKIKTVPVLWSQTRTRLRLITSVKIVPYNFEDENGEPLVPDLPDGNDIYLDPRYGPREHDKHSELKALGLKSMNALECVERIGRDAISSNSKMKLADDDWHVRVAGILLLVFEKSNFHYKITYLKSLPLIPLGEQRWTSIIDGAVYFSHTDEMPIPSDLGLRLIDSRSVKNAIRKELYTKIGVENAPKILVRGLILGKHREDWTKITLQSSVAHLQYLYWTQLVSSLRSGSISSLRKRSNFCMFDDLGDSIDATHDLYFITDGDNGTKNLLALVRQENKPTELHSFGSLINPEYLNASNWFMGLPSSKLSFETYLESEVHVLRYPRLIDPEDFSRLSKIFLFLAEKHPEQMLRTLKSYWDAIYRTELDTYPVLKQKIAGIKVSFTNVGGVELGETFLPLEHLEADCSVFLDTKKFPFLKFYGACSLLDWKFLETFGVGMESNVYFYLEILRRLKESKAEFSYKIYEELQQNIWTSNDRIADIKRVKDIIFSDDLLYIPSCYEWAQQRWSWTGKCIWDGPSYMRTKYSLLPALSDINNPILTAFFINTLGVQNLSQEDLISELLSIKRASSVIPDNIYDIYTRLQDMLSSESVQKLDIIRERFEQDSLVYDTIRKAWVPSSSCLWSKDAQIPGKVTILSQYGDLKNFFVGILQVKIPDLGMLVDELSQVVSSKLSTDDVKSLIWQINSFSPSRKALEKLKALPIIPVRTTSTGLASIVLRVRNERFSITDRQPWAEALLGRIDVLDFNLEEVRALQPILSALDLENRYLSRVVREVSSFQGEVGEQCRKRTRQLRSHAHALARCAAHFGSPRIHDNNLFIYHLLLKAEVYETDGIITNLVHTQLFETVTIEVSKTKVHISEDLGKLKVYIPKNRKDQELCFLQFLPMKLFNEVMMGKKTSNSTLASDSEAVRIIAALFMSSDEVVGDLLDNGGIIAVSYVDEFNGETYDRDGLTDELAARHAVYSQANSDAQEHPLSNADIEQSPERRSSSTGSRLLSPTPNSSHRTNYRTATPTYRQPSVTSSPFQSSTAQSYEPAQFSVKSSQVEYQRLLSNVITAAKSKKGRFPTMGAFNLDDLLNALPLELDPEPVYYDLPFGTRSENQLAHDMKVGAAGELYAFEILSRLETQLPGFGRDNWQSTIRRYVTIHEDYKDMDAWRGAETADITYEDQNGDFTKLLVEHGYLDDIWSGAKPKYYLEVKTTTKECGTRLFISKSQYQRMERMRLKKGEVSSEVYIILRVFNLDKDSIDMRLYVDPKGLEEGGRLVFTPESYSVLPAGSQTS